MWSVDWPSFGRVILLVVVAYFSLTALIRLFGKRTISKMNPGDFVITVAVGSLAANLIINKDVPLVIGLTALVSLLGLQFLTEWVTSHVSRLRQMMDGSPVLLVHNGQMLQHNMRRENVDEEDIFAVLREHGLGRVSDAQAVVLEIDGSFSVIAAQVPVDDAIKDVRHES